LLQGDAGELQINKDQIIVGFLCPPHKESSRAVGPRVAPFDDPASGELAFAATPEVRLQQGQLVDPPHQPQVLRRFAGRLVISTAARQTQQFALPPQAQLVMLRLDQRPPRVNRAGQIFFQPLDLHFEATDLLEQLFLVVLLGALLATPISEQVRRPFQQPLLPGRDLRGMHAELTGQLPERLVALKGASAIWALNAPPRALPTAALPQSPRGLVELRIAIFVNSDH